MSVKRWEEYALLFALSYILTTLSHRKWDTDGGFGGDGQD
jgi:hypothetical protein